MFQAASRSASVNWVAYSTLKWNLVSLSQYERQGTPGTYVVSLRDTSLGMYEASSFGMVCDTLSESLHKNESDAMNQYSLLHDYCRW